MPQVFQFQEADAGDFLNGRVCWDILHACGCHLIHEGDIVDLSHCRLIRPCGIACLCAAAARVNRAVQLVTPEDPACRDHLARMGVFDWFNAQGPAPGAVLRATNIVVQQLVEGPGDFSTETIRVLTNLMPAAAGTLPRLADHLDEVILNALTHGDWPAGCVVAGQGFPARGWVEVAIADLGLGIPSHLRRNPAHAGVGPDGDAIVLATGEGITGTVGLNRWGQPNTGVGLFELREHCRRGGGEMGIVSGGALVGFGTDDPQIRRFYGGFQGSLVNVRFFVN